MRTTINLDPDVAAAAERLRRERHLGLSEAVNELARAGLRARREHKPFRQRSRDIGVRVDLSNVAEALEILEDEDFHGDR
jgi:Arc/MetJ family transcription regulator